LGQHHYRRGDLDQSIAVYRRALHLIRVNDGLSSPRQIPVLLKMAGIYRSTGDLLSLGDVYQYYYRVRKLGEPPYTQERLDDSLEYLTPDGSEISTDRLNLSLVFQATALLHSTNARTLRFR
jgi:hypothetical protein